MKSEMFAVYSLLPAVYTNNSIGNKWIESNFFVYFVVYREFFFHAYEIFLLYVNRVVYCTITSKLAS